MIENSDYCTFQSTGRTVYHNGGWCSVDCDSRGVFGACYGSDGGESNLTPEEVVEIADSLLAEIADVRAKAIEAMIARLGLEPSPRHEGCPIPRGVFTKVLP